MYWAHHIQRRRAQERVLEALGHGVLLNQLLLLVRGLVQSLTYLWPAEARRTHLARVVFSLKQARSPISSPTTPAGVVARGGGFCNEAEIGDRVVEVLSVTQAGRNPRLDTAGQRESDS